MGEHQCGFKRNSSTADHIFINKYLKRSGNTTKLFIDFEKAYDSIRRKSLYDILIKIGLPKINQLIFPLRAI